MVRSHIDWNKCKTFYYIAQAGSFVKAAKILNATQPGLSRTIQLLEESLGIKLFNRHSRGVFMTPQGEILFKRVEKAHREFIESVQDLKDFKEVKEKIYRVEGEFIVKETGSRFLEEYALERKDQGGESFFLHDETFHAMGFKEVKQA